MRLSQLRQSRGYQVLITIGLVSYGLVHLVVGWIALQLALGGRGEASPQGALRQLARQPLGGALMWAMAVGLLTLACWQGLEVTVGRESGPGGQARQRLRSAGRSLVYLALGVSAGAVALGARSTSGEPEETLTARLMSVPFGQALVVAVGATVLAVGVGQVLKGVRHKFREDLAGGVAPPVITLGTVGYTAKGIALVIVGLLFGWAALTHDPQKAGGLDAALGSIRSQPFGAALLAAMAAGIACFGLFCFAWAKNARH